MKKKLTAKDSAYIGLSAALLAVCAFITVPLGAVPVTLQTLGVCLVAGLLGWKRGALATLLYVFIGALGVPIFAGFKGGLGVLAGPTGGYIVGFLFTALLVGAVSDKTEGRLLHLALSMVLGVAVCYAFGTLWFALVFMKNGEPKSLGTILSLCVYPFILPDLIKIAVAAALCSKLKKRIE